MPRGRTSIPSKLRCKRGTRRAFAKHDAAASLLCRGSNEPRQPQLLSNPIPRRVGSDQNAQAGEIAAVPFGKRARLVQLGGASAKLPSSLVKIKPKQLVGGSMHLLGIAVQPRQSCRAFEGIFDEVFAMCSSFFGGAARSLRRFSLLPPRHQVTRRPNGPQRVSSCSEFDMSLRPAIADLRRGKHAERIRS